VLLDALAANDWGRAAKWEVASEVPLRARGGNRWWCVGHMVRDDRRSVVTLLLQGENRKLVVW
jgi:hypothetical protein